MAMRMSGLMSGMDTESIVQQLVEVRSSKVKKAKNAQTKLEWKQDAWKELNKKLKSLQSKLNDLRFTGGYAKKATKISDSSVASVLTSGNAMNGVQSLEVKKLAKTAYMTGTKVSLREGVSGSDVSAVTPMQFLMNFEKDSEGKEMAKHLTLHKGDGSKTDIQLDSNTSISDVLTQLKDAGLNANYDAGQNRFFISSKETGVEAGFMITGDADALKALGLQTSQVQAGGQVTIFGDIDHRDYFEKEGEEPNLYMGQLIDNWTLPGSDDEIVGRWINVTDAQGKTTKIKVGKYDKVDDFVEKVRKEAGVDFAYDDRERRFYAGAGVTFTNDALTNPYKEGEVGEANDVVKKLGLFEMKPASDTQDGASFVRGQDAEISLNGATFTSATNVFEINGLTITTQAETDPGKSVTLTTGQDTDGVYNLIKDFLKAYNEVINEMDKLYGADSAKDYEPLSDDEKSNMSEAEIEKYEQKIKDSLLRRDANLSSISSVMKKVMLQGVRVNGIQMYLSNFGIGTLSYFSAPDGERNAYHIDGDSDDTNTASLEDKLKQMITTDPDTVTSFFSQLTMNLYTEMDKQSRSVEGYRSFGNFYDDKKMKSDYDDYKSKIKTLEEKLADYEDKWYRKFSKMETAMAKLQKNVSAITGLLGGSS